MRWASSPQGAELRVGMWGCLGLVPGQVSIESLELEKSSRIIQSNYQPIPTVTTCWELSACGQRSALGGASGLQNLSTWQDKRYLHLLLFILMIFLHLVYSGWEHRSEQIAVVQWLLPTKDAVPLHEPLRGSTGWGSLGQSAAGLSFVLPDNGGIVGLFVSWQYSKSRACCNNSGTTVLSRCCSYFSCVINSIKRIKNVCTLKFAFFLRWVFWTVPCCCFVRVQSHEAVRHCLGWAADLSLFVFLLLQQHCFYPCVSP